MANTLKLGAGKWATGTDTVLAFNDENNNFKPLPFDFSRASSGTIVNQSGLIETVGSGTPRIDFLGNTKGALLLEPQRTNVIPRSEDIDIGWSKLNVTVANNQTVSPDGTLNAALSTVTSTNGQHASYDTLSSSVTSGQPYYISCFVKKSNTRYIRLNEGYTGDQLYYDFDNNIATLGGGASDKIVEDFGNGWFRIGFKFVPTTVNSQFALYLNDNSNNNSYAGSGEDVYIYGAQIEQGSYPTSYIPTSGSAVTRVADSCSNNWDGLDVTTESFSFYTEFNISAVNGVVVSKKQSLGATNGWALQLNSSGILKLYVFGGSTEKTAQLLDLSLNVNHKVVGIIDRVNDLLHLYVDGTLSQSTDISTITGTLLSTYDFTLGSLGNGTAISNINTNSFNYYNTALTDSEAIALTQI